MMLLRIREQVVGKRINMDLGLLLSTGVVTMTIAQLIKNSIEYHVRQKQAQKAAIYNIELVDNDEYVPKKKLNPSDEGYQYTPYMWKEIEMVTVYDTEVSDRVYDTGTSKLKFTTTN